MGQLKLRDHLRCKVVLPLALGMLTCVLVAIILLYRSVDPWHTQTADAVQRMELDASATRVSKLNEHLEVIYERLDNDLAVLRNATYASYLQHQPVRTYPRSFYGASLGGVAAINPPQDDVTRFSNKRTGAGFERNSAILYPGKTTWSEVMADATVNRTALLDAPFRALYKTSRGGDMNAASSYMNLMIGFESSFYRRYPYPSGANGFPADYTDGSVQYCDGTVDPSFAYRVGYYPQCRPWYVQAKQAQQARRGSGGTWSAPPDISVFSTPYIDAASKAVTISASTPLFDVTQPATLPFLGVINIDFNMSVVDNVVLGRRSLSQTGYFFLMDARGNLISHPRFTDRSVTATVEALEPALAPTLRGILAAGASSGVGVVTRTQATASNGQAYHVYWTVNAVTGYVVTGVIPASDFVEMRRSILSSLKSSLDPGTAGVVIVLAFLIVALTYGTWRIANYYASILEDATIILSQAQKPNLKEQLLVREPVCYELDLLFKQFQPMLVAVNFGNDSYYDGNMDKALADYQVAEQLLQRMKNKKGLATVANNKGNVYLKMNKHAEAETHYRQAISLGQEALRECEVTIADINASLSSQAEASSTLVEQKRKLQQTRLGLYTALAKRTSNLAVLFKNRARHAEAYAMLNEAIRYYQQADDDVGEAQTASNLAQFLIQDNRLSEAQNTIQATYSKLSTLEDGKKPDPHALHYATLTLGILCDAQQKPMDATGWFQYTLLLQETHQIVDSQVQQTCFQHLQYLFEKLQNREMSDRYRRLRLRNLILKDVMFGLDVSGSMSGGKIQRCRQSIVDVITNYVQPEDRIGLVTFSNKVRTVFPLTLRGFYDDTLQKFRTAVVNDTRTDGQTALWDAISQSVEQLKALQAQEKRHDATATRNQWLIALTDGEDNQSLKTPGMVRQQLLQYPVHLIIITVGANYDRQAVADVIQAVKQKQKQAHHIAIESESIAKAFESVAKLITHQLHVEKL